MKKLFLCLMVFIALSSCEDRDLDIQKDDVLLKTNKPVDESQNSQTSKEPGELEEVGPVVTIPPR